VVSKVPKLQANGNPFSKIENYSGSRSSRCNINI